VTALGRGSALVGAVERYGAHGAREQLQLVDTCPVCHAPISVHEEWVRTDDDGCLDAGLRYAHPLCAWLDPEQPCPGGN
jgi:hypothetical protein